jgi:adenylate cyclase
LCFYIRAARGLMLYFADRVEETIAILRDVIERSPDHAPGYWIQGMALAAAGNFEGSIASSEIALGRMGRIGRVLGYYGYAVARAGREQEARHLLQEIEEQPQQSVPAYFRAMVLLGLGERAAALTLLERAWAERESMLRELRGERVWDSLRDEPRFNALVTRLGYPGLPAAATRPLLQDDSGSPKV